MDNKNVKLIVIGIITGLINGLFGSGGGIIVVSSLVFIIGLEDHKAHATAISIVLPLTIISTGIYLFKNSIPMKLSLYVMTGGIIGSYIGARILNKIPINILRKIFGGVIFYTGVRMILG